MTQRRGAEDRVVLVEEYRPGGRRRTRTISVAAADVRRRRSAPLVAAAEKLLDAGLPAPDRDHRNTATPEGVSPQLRRIENG